MARCRMKTTPLSNGQEILKLVKFQCNGMPDGYR
jgi:hypothetical protein